MDDDGRAEGADQAGRWLEPSLTSSSGVKEEVGAFCFREALGDQGETNEGESTAQWFSRLMVSPSSDDIQGRPWDVKNVCPQAPACVTLADKSERCASMDHKQAAHGPTNSLDLSSTCGAVKCASDDCRAAEFGVAARRRRASLPTMPVVNRLGGG